jgi:Protein phosphatase 2C
LGAGLNWRVVAARAAGSAHELTGTPCQDHCYRATVSGRDGAHYLIALVADGAGSALHSEAGSRLACETGGRFLRDYVERQARGAGTAVKTSLATDCLARVRAALAQAADQAGATPRDFACTLIGLVAGPHQTLAFQIGDGAVIVRQAGQLAPVFWPDAGEYANMTYFVTDQDAAEHLHVAQFETPQEVSLMTDGLQRLALVFATRQVHAPFFEPMFSVLRGLSAQQCAELDVQLANFLASPAVSARTDDDKTLILATRLGPEGLCP